MKFLWAHFHKLMLEIGLLCIKITRKTCGGKQKKIKGHQIKRDALTFISSRDLGYRVRFNSVGHKNALICILRQFLWDRLADWLARLLLSKSHITGRAGKVDKHRARKVWVKKLSPNRRIEWEKTIEKSNRRRINIDCLAQVGIRHSGAELTTFGGI